MKIIKLATFGGSGSSDQFHLPPQWESAAWTYPNRFREASSLFSTGRRTCASSRYLAKALSKCRRASATFTSLSTTWAGTLSMPAAKPYARDLKDIEIHMLDTGHFALETHGEEVASRIESFFLKRQSKAA
jgi:hypothetical protein